MWGDKWVTAGRDNLELSSHTSIKSGLQNVVIMVPNGTLVL